MLSGIREKASLRNDIPLPFVQGRACRKRICFCYVLDGIYLRSGDRAPDVLHDETVTVFELVIVIDMLELEGQDAEVDKVRAVDPCE